MYHRLSSYTYTPPPYPVPPIDHPLVVQDFVPNDLERLPPPWKVYPPDLPRVELPRVWPSPRLSATAVLAGQPVHAATSLDLSSLARLLHLSAGVVRLREPTATRRLLWFRAAGSAGGRFPLELYVSTRDVDGLPDGVHWYDPLAHTLVQLGPPARGAATTLIVTGVPWRTTWRYAERGFRHIYWDAGSMLAQTLVLAESSGLAPRLWTRFSDAEVSDLVAADGVEEFPVALIGLGAGEPAIHPTGDAIPGSIGETPTEFPLLTLAQRAGNLTMLGQPWAAALPLTAAFPDSAVLDTVILRRGSARRMDPESTVGFGVFQFSMAAAMRGMTVPHFIAVHGVESLDAGLYRWPNLDQPLRRERLREEMLLSGWDANLVRDAAFVVIGAVDLESLDDREYREAQLQSGIVEGRLHLAAYALGIGASGMTFLDSEIEGLLGEPLAGLLFTCVGVPTYPNKAGGMPGAPVAVLTPQAGDTPRSTHPEHMT
jgi:SagB-type dehydrogenase family enzyme